jgi:hypothetical protein
LIVKRSGCYFSFIAVFFLLSACAGGDKVVIKDRFLQNPKVGVIYTPSQIRKFPDFSPGGPQAKWSAPVPADFESIAKNQIVTGLKAEWPDAAVTYESSGTNKLKYDLVVWVDVGGEYHVQTPSSADTNIVLKMRTVLAIYDPHSSRNLTSFTGVQLGEVSSPSARTNAASVFVEVIPPVTLKAALENRAAQGIKDYFSEVKSAQK